MILYTIQQPDGSTFPPKSIEEIRKLAQEGKITQEHFIQIEGGQTWHPVSQIHGVIPSDAREQVSSRRVQNSVKNAGQSAKTQISNKLPILKNKFFSLKETIMKSTKNKIIAGSCAIVFLLFIMVVFSGGGGIHGHLDSLKSAANNMDIAANSGDAYALMESMEELAMSMESMNADSEALIQELSDMNEIQRNALALSFLMHIKQAKTEPSQAARLSMMTQFGKDPALAIRFQEVENRISNMELNPLLEDLLKPNN